MANTNPSSSSLMNLQTQLKLLTQLLDSSFSSASQQTASLCSSMPVFSIHGNNNMPASSIQQQSQCGIFSNELSNASNSSLMNGMPHVTQPMTALASNVASPPPRYESHSRAVSEDLLASALADVMTAPSCSNAPFNSVSSSNAMLVESMTLSDALASVSDSSINMTSMASHSASDTVPSFDIDSLLSFPSLSASLGSITPSSSSQNASSLSTSSTAAAAIKNDTCLNIDTHIKTVSGNSKKSASSSPSVKVESLQSSDSNYTSSADSGSASSGKRLKRKRLCELELDINSTGSSRSGSVFSSPMSPSMADTENGVDCNMRKKMRRRVTDASRNGIMIALFKSLQRSLDPSNKFKARNGKGQRTKLLQAAVDAIGNLKQQVSSLSAQLTISNALCNSSLQNEQLDQQNSLLASSFLNASVAMSMVDMTGVCVDVNDAYCNMFHTRRQDKFGKPLSPALSFELRHMLDELKLTDRVLNNISYSKNMQANSQVDSTLLNLLQMHPVFSSKLKSLLSGESRVINLVERNIDGLNRIVQYSVQAWAVWRNGLPAYLVYSYQGAPEVLLSIPSVVPSAAQVTLATPSFSSASPVSPAPQQLFNLNLNFC